ncbi:hypothetical protein BGZ51_009423 [Haplosporangium sp. Z 767]|nr:hypothetical protein BGZ51_009423 [Haplosporangium sp. Z 767]
MDLISALSISLSYLEGTITLMLGADILAMRSDGPQDSAWSGADDRARTVFEAIQALKHTGYIDVNVSLTRQALSSTFLVNVHIFLHQGLFVKTLNSKRISIDLKMQDLVQFIFPPTSAATQLFTTNAIKDLYAHLRPAAMAEPPRGIQPELLIPQLLPFQRRSIAWCLQRECGIVNEAGKVEYKEPTVAEKLPFSWEQVSVPQGNTLFINRLCGLICPADPGLVAEELEPRGGILADEMGLGKTVETLALILLNRRKPVPVQGDDVSSETDALERRLSAAHLDNSSSAGSAMEIESDKSSTQEVIPASDSEATTLITSGATLIITPVSILHQWASEIENHAPSLRTYIYVEDSHTRISAAELAAYDIVLTTYPVLSKEINFASHYERSRRYERQYKPRKSAFVSIDWWRVCLDEAQMVEGTSVSQAAAMTLLIPRVMSWAISGTPIRRSIEDLHSLLKFLDQEPVASNKRLWRLLSSPNFRPTFVSSYQRIMHRYAKRDVAHELALPPQIRLAYGVNFTEIERANYNEIWEQCLTECNVDNADPDNNETENLQKWFMRLRQTCCHPQIGARNKDAFGKTNLQTIDEVLGVMIQQVGTQLYTRERAYQLVKTKRAILNARIHKDLTELPLFTQIERDIERHVEFWKGRYSALVAKRAQDRALKAPEATGKGKGIKLKSAEEIEGEDEDIMMASGKTGQTADDVVVASMHRHREWLEQLHRILFFTAGFYHDLNMEAEETHFYERAEAVRQQILAQHEKSFNRHLQVVRNVVGNMVLDDKCAIPPSDFTGGIVMSRHLEQLQFVTRLLNQQLKILAKWRHDLVEKLTQPLMQDGEEGEQYQYSIDLQHTLESYLYYYGRMLLFRKDLVSGTEEGIAQLVANVKSQRERAEMVKRRENRIRTFSRKKEAEKKKKEEENLDTRLENEMNDMITEELVSTLRSVRNNIKSIATDDSRPEAERNMAEIEDRRLKEEQNHQVKLTMDLEREITDFRALTASRTVYYRQLQAISDTVRDIESMNPEEDVGDCLEEEAKLQAEIVRLTSKQRYLEHISEDSSKESQSDEDRLCLICRNTYELGLMTECGHVFCKLCLLEWTKDHGKCPSCNSQISRRRLKQVTMSGPVATAVVSSSTDAKESTSSKPSSSPSDAIPVRSRTSHMLLIPEMIRRLSIQDGYGSKIDSIVRHIAYLVREDPTIKCLVFSQWSNLLRLLEKSLFINRIGYVKLDGSSIKTAVKQFKEDQDKHVFMLHAKSQSAGLTLLSATHIFICEPLVNPVLQAQAVSRVHRIGQTKETFVHYYLIRDTVEIPCYNLFERNLATAAGALVHNNHEDTDPGKASSSSSAYPTKESTGLDADVATTTASEVARAQNRNGELVKLEDLKYCFQVQKQMNQEDTHS